MVPLTYLNWLNKLRGLLPGVPIRYSQARIEHIIRLDSPIVYKECEILAFPTRRLFFFRDTGFAHKETGEELKITPSRQPKPKG